MMADVRVLVIEDDEDTGFLLGELLHREGFLTTVICHGRDALRAAVQSACDVIVLDLVLRDVDGLAVLRDLRSDPRTATVPVIVATAGGVPHGLETARALGAFDAFLKPVHLDVLAAALHAAAKSR